MHILVTNDDGITAPGLRALARAMRALGTVSVIAPDRNWSASGHVKTMHKPLRALAFDLMDGIEAFATNGAPSDSVALALLGLLAEPIDLVVSGINPRANLGHDAAERRALVASIPPAVLEAKPGAIRAQMASGRRLMRR